MFLAGVGVGVVAALAVVVAGIACYLTELGKELVGEEN